MQTHTCNNVILTMKILKVIIENNNYSMRFEYEILAFSNFFYHEIHFIIIES